MGRNIWHDFANKVDKGPMALTFFIISMTCFAAGMAMMYADYTASYVGLAEAETAFSIRMTDNSTVRFFMSLSPQLMQMGLLMWWSLDTSRRWALYGAIAAFFIDFGSDLQYVSNGHFLPATGGVNLDSTTMVSAISSLIFFTIGSEILLLVGSGGVTTLFEPAVNELSRFIAAIVSSLIAAVATIKSSFDAHKKPVAPPKGQSSGGGGGNNNKNNNARQGQPQRTQPQAQQAQPQRHDLPPLPAEYLPQNDMNRQ